ncbi:MAG TPA: carboxypeptidase-like regulatory domain-containing protein, partial [Gemmatimonadaceae bacterium]
MPMTLRHLRSWSCCLALAIAAPLALAAQQTQRVHGRVTDASNGQPIANVQISVTGTLLGTMTTQAGDFTIPGVPVGTRTVVARRIGFATTRHDVDVTEGTQAEVNFALSPVAATLEEVVVSGVGAPAARRVVGNTVETVAGDEISESPAATSIDQALQGKITGAVISQNSGQPGGGVSIRLRGTNSILGGSEPLYVVDGVIVDNSSDALISLSANADRGNASLSNALSDLDPDDIERIEVLKGAAAAALYGSRANNGVIQIFTKHGRAGETSVTLKSEYSMSRIAKRYDLNMSPFAGYTDVLYGGADSIGAPIQRWDLQDEILRTGKGTSNQLSVSGGSGSTTFFVSGGYDYNQGIINNTDYRRWNLRTNLSQKLSSKIDVAVRGSYTDSKANYVPEGEQTQGVLTSVIFTPTSVNQFFDKAIGRYPYNPVLGANPLDVMNNWQAPEQVTRMVGGFEATARPFSSLTLKYLVGLDDYRREDKYFQPPYSTSASFTGSVQNPVA